MLQSHLMKSVIQKIPVEIAVILIIFVVFFAGYLLLPDAESDAPEITHFLSSYEQGVYGTSRLYEFIGNLNVKVDSHSEDFLNKISDETGIIFILNPEIEIKYSEQVSIRNWVEKGGVVVYGCNIEGLIDHSRDIGELYSGYGFSPPWEMPVFETEYIAPFDAQLIYNPGDLEEGIKVGSIEPANQDQIFKNVSSIQAPFFSNEKSLVRPVFVIILYDLDGTVLTENEWETIATEDGMTSIIGREIGEGRIIAIANPLIFANGYIEAGDNIQFVYNLISSVPNDKTIIFDEYRHGYSSAESRKVLDTGWGRVFLLVILVGILAVYSKAVRFVPPKASPSPERRSQVEYLRSMAQILRRAKATKVVSGIMLREFRNIPGKNERIERLKAEMKTELAEKNLSESKIMKIINKIISLENRTSGT